MIRFFLFCLRSVVVLILLGVALMLVVSGGCGRVEPDGVVASQRSGGVAVSRAPQRGTDWAKREEESKRKLVSSVPELGLPGHALREEFDRRARLFRSINPAFFDSPDWPQQLWLLMVRDLSLEERPVVYPWKSDGMGSARP